MSRVFGLFIAFFLFVTNADAQPDLWKGMGWRSTDFSKSIIDFSEILSGGPPKDGIPSIDAPKFVSIADATTLGDKEPVIIVEVNGDARAYPLRVLIWHEIVNDEVGGKPLTITYCPLCNSALVFEREFEGRLLDFGTTGLLRNSDLVMYDRQTETWWQQFTGQGIVGEMAGKELTMVPVRTVSFESFRDSHPGGKVLVPNNPGMRQYGRNPYMQYDSRQTPYGLFRGSLPEDINPMIRVVLVRDDDNLLAVAMPKLRKDSQVVAGDITIEWSKGQNSALDAGTISEGRDVGNVSVWRRADGDKEAVVHDVTFAFVVHAFHPDLKILQ